MEQDKKSLENLDISDVQNISKDISGAALEELSLKNLDKNLQILREIGIQEIYKATKIASKNIHSILEKRYKSLSKVHALQEFFSPVLFLSSAKPFFISDPNPIKDLPHLLFE